MSAQNTPQAPAVVIPLDFPHTLHDAVARDVADRLQVHPVPSRPLNWRPANAPPGAKWSGTIAPNGYWDYEFIGAWQGVKYRFIACSEHDESYTASVKRAGNSPGQPERYIQDRELFDFFVCGLSSLECFCYGLYAFASDIDRQTLPFSSDQHKRNATIRNTVKAFIKSFPQEPLTKALSQFEQENDFRDWERIRNVLAHRVTPGRDMYELAGIPQQSWVEWSDGVTIDEHTTKTRRQWLAQILTELLTEASAFTTKFK